MQRHKHVVNIEELEWRSADQGDRFAFDRMAFTGPAGGEMLGCSLFRVPPGKTAFPRHSHHANEEAIFILAGSGTLHLGQEQVAVRQGDYIALPRGAELAHQLWNTTEEPLEYLCVSTMVQPEVTEYPDSGKLGVFAGSAPGGPAAKRVVSGFYRKDSDVDYYEGE